MFKKLALMLALATIVCTATRAASGDWRVHPFYAEANINKIIDTDTKVYYLVGNDVYCYDKSTGTNESYNRRNNLNDVLATNIYYNYDEDYLVITYIDSNIDIIDQNGNVTNLPDIKDVVLSGNKGINDVTFASGRMYVATEFGMLVYNDETFSVIEARLFNVNFSTAAQVDDWVLISRANAIYAARVSGSRENYTSYAAVNGITTNTTAKLIPLGGRRFIVNGSKGVVAYTLSDSVKTNGATAIYVTQIDTLSTARATMVQQIPNGIVASFKTGSYYIIADANGKNARQVAADKELVSAWPGGNGTLWGLSAKGVRQMGTETYHKPDGIGIAVGAYYMVFNKELNKLYLSAASDNLMAEWSSSHGAVTSIYTYDGSQWENVTPTGLPGSGVGANWQLAMDPFLSNTYVYPSRKYGVFKIVDDKYNYRYYNSNSYFADGFYKGACAFDTLGNLWVCYSSATASNAAVNLAVLPRDKFLKATCAKSDWKPVQIQATRQKDFKGSSFVVGKGNVKVYNGGGYQNAIVFWNDTDPVSTTPQTAAFTNLTDTDGNNISWINVFCMTTDLDGLVWAGMDNGIAAFDPSKALEDNFTVLHPKVDRNDSTGMTDFLVDGLQVNSIAVDAQNCKWIGTNASGLYQVSPDGTKIINYFNTDNSYLPSNTIFSVCCNTNTNSVYVLTSSGFVEYQADASPAAQNYDNVYVYPNPVRPDFTGLLTISELMDNSYVTIKDSTGTTVKQLRSTGGIAKWDCCNDSGDRMPTGLYSVYASQKASDRNPKKVSEFLIIK